MRLVILDDYDLASEWAAKYIRNRIITFRPTAQRYFTLGLPTGEGHSHTHAIYIYICLSGTSLLMCPEASVSVCVCVYVTRVKQHVLVMLKCHQILISKKYISV